MSRRKKKAKAKKAQPTHKRGKYPWNKVHLKAWVGHCPKEGCGGKLHQADKRYPNMVWCDRCGQTLDISKQEGPRDGTS